MPVDLDALRDLLRDTDELVFTDENLQAAIDASGDESIYRAAGMAIHALALEYALTGKSVRTEDLTIDTKGRGSTLLEVANSYFAQAATADSAEANSFFEIIPFGGRTSTTCRVEASPRPCCSTGACGWC